jgi:DNA-binding SARP family transcriptional activator
VDIGILGPLEVRGEGKPVEVGTRKARVLLAALVLGRNQVVSADALIEAAWPNDLPANPRAALQTSVARLRRALPDGARLETLAGGYRLHARDGEVDADRFESLVGAGRSALAAGDPGGAASRLREALHLWRGPVLDDLGDAEFARSERTRLSELRMAATVDRIDAELALGRHRELTAELETLVNANPVREDLVVRLVLALYRDGRQQDALDRCARFRRRLHDELGLQPSSGLTDLEHRVLVQDPGLEHATPRAGSAGQAPPSERSRPLPRSVMALRPAAMIGREEQLRSMVERLSDPHGGTRTVVLTGEAGIGKTRLMAEVASELADRGSNVLSGRCTPSPLIPGEPIVEIVEQVVEQQAGDLRRILGDRLTELGRLVPDLHLRMPGVAPPGPVPADAVSYLSARAFASVLDVAAEAGPVLLLVDDVQSADGLTVDLLRHVLRRAEEPVAAIMTRRGGGAAIDALLEDAGHDGTLVTLALEGLSPEETSALVEREVSGQVSPWMGRAVHEHTGGNAFFTLEIARHLGLRKQPRSALASELPPNLLAVVQRRIDELGPAAGSALRTAALLGTEFVASVVLRACPHEDAAAGLAAAERASIIHPVPSAPGRFRFGHGVTVTALERSFAPGEAERTHEAIGRALEESPANGHAARAALAHHWRLAGDAHVARAALRTEAAALDALQRRAYEQVTSLCQAGIDALAAAGVRDEQYLRLLVLAADAASATVDQARATALVEEALDLARELGDHQTFARAALAAVPVLPDARWAAILEEAVQRTPTDDAARPMLKACLGSMLAASDPSRADQLIDEVRRESSGSVDVALTGRLLAYDVFHGSGISPQRRISAADEIISRARDLGRSVVLLDALTFRGTARLELGDRAAAERDFAEHARLASELRSPGALAVDAQRRAMRSLLAGRPDDAEAHVHDAMFQVSDDRAWIAVYGGQLVAVKEAQGRYADMLLLLDLQDDEDRARPISRTTRAMALARVGDRPQAQAALDELVGELPSWRQDLFWTIAVANLADTATALRDRAAAEQLVEVLRPLDDRVAVFAMAAVCWGAVARFLAPMEDLLDRSDDAVHHHERAIELHEGLDSPALLVRDLTGLANLLVRRDREGDAVRARSLERQAAQLRSRWSLPAHPVQSLVG